MANFCEQSREYLRARATVAKRKMRERKGATRAPPPNNNNKKKNPNAPGYKDDPYQ